MPSSLAACARLRVTAASSGLGVGSPEGWLWLTMMLGGGLEDGGAQHLCGPDDGRGDVALVDDSLADDVVLGVQKQHPELLLGQRGHLRSEQPAHVFGAVDGGQVSLGAFRLGLHVVAHGELSQQAQVASQRVQQRGVLGGVPLPGHVGLLRYRLERERGRPLWVGAAPWCARLSGVAMRWRARRGEPSSPACSCAPPLRESRKTTSWA